MTMRFKPGLKSTFKGLMMLEADVSSSEVLVGTNICLLHISVNIWCNYTAISTTDGLQRYSCAVYGTCLRHLLLTCNLSPTLRRLIFGYQITSV